MTSATRPSRPAPAWDDLPEPGRLGEIDPRWADLELVWIDTAVGRVRALVGGPWQEPDGPAPRQLLVHGLGASSLSWVDAAAAMVARGAAVVALDQPGFGQSRPVADWRGTLPDLEDAVVAGLDALGWRSCTLHGNSLGGLLVLRVADRLRDRLDGVVLAAPAVPLSLHRAWPLPLGTVLSFGLVALPFLGELALRRAAASGAPFDESMVDRVFVDTERVLSPEMEALFAGETEAFRTQPWRQRAMLAATRATLPVTALGGIGWRGLADDLGDVPLVVVWGAQDGLLPPGMQDEVAARRPAWRAEVWQQSAHVPQADEPERYADLALDLTAVRLLDEAS